MTAPRPAADPIMAIVSIKSQQVTFYDADGWILRAPVSTGTTGRETPAGVFAVLEKNKEHHSSLYDDASMPNMLRITWNGIALHGGPLPGYAASHGCIRMPFDFAAKVFDKAPMGMRVIISPTDAEPVAFSDPALFVPKQDAIDAAPELAAATARDADDAAKAAAAAKAAVAPAKRAAAAAPAAVHTLTALKVRADAELAHAEKALAAVNANPKMTDQAKAVAQAAAQDAQQKAAAKAQALAAQLEAAKADLKAKQDAAAAAVAAAKATEAKRAETASAATAAKLAGAPVSIYISRATQKLYVRRDTHKKWSDGGELYDFSQEFPVAIKDPDKPLGTHIFTAVARDGGGLRWTEVSIDNGDNAKDALDRITFPQEVLDKIAPTAVPLSSIVISDEPLSSDRLSRRIRRGLEQPAAGSLHHPRAVAEQHGPRAQQRRWRWVLSLRRLVRLIRQSPSAAARQTAGPRRVVLSLSAIATLTELHERVHISTTSALGDAINLPLYGQTSVSIEIGVTPPNFSWQSCGGRLSVRF